MNGSLLLKIIAVVLVINVVYASFAHQKGKLTIYVDWTDAGMTAATPVVMFFCYYLLIQVFGASQSIAKTISLAVGSVMVYLGLRLCWRANNAMVAFLVAAAAKYTMMILVYLTIGAILASGARKKHERETTAVKRNAAGVTAIAAGYAAWSVWVSRVAQFTPVANWIAATSHTLITGGVQQEAEQALAD